MTISPLAGRPAPKEMLVNLAQLGREYYERRPDVTDPNQLVNFGTSGHRGSPLAGTFTQDHKLAITQAICDYRRSKGTDGPVSWARIHTRFPGRRSGRQSRFWRPTECRPLSSATTA